MASPPDKPQGSLPNPYASKGLPNPYAAATVAESGPVHYTDEQKAEQQKKSTGIIYSR
jgi:splicing factor 45